MNSSVYRKRKIQSAMGADTRRIQNVGTIASTRVKMAETIGFEGGTKFKKLYCTSRWLRLREEVLKRDMYTCQLCGAVGDVAGKLVCDHVRGHPPDETEEMFWAGPFQCVCYNCHNTTRAKEDNERKRKWFVK